MLLSPSAEWLPDHQGLQTAITGASTGPLHGEVVILFFTVMVSVFVSPLQVTTDLPRDSISEHLSDSNSARTAASIAVEHSRVSRSSASDGQSDTITMETNDTAQGGRAGNSLNIIKYH